MKQPHIIAETDLRLVDLKYWENKPLNSYYDKIKSFLTQSLGTNYGVLLTEPNLKKGTEKIRWIATSSSTNIYPIQESVDESVKASAAEVLVKINTLAEELLNSSNSSEQEWGKLLQFIFDNISLTDLFTDGDSFFLPAWGVNTLDGNKEGNFATNFTPPSKQELTNASEEEDIKESDSPPRDTEASKDNIEEEHILDSSEPMATDNSELLEAHDESTDPSLSDSFIHNEFEDTNSTLDEEEDWPIEEEDQDPEKKEKTANTKTTAKNNWWKWLLGILALLLLLFLLSKSCNTTNEILPPNPMIPPVVDSTDIGYGSDSLNRIIKNRINIVISGDKSIKTFAEDFDKVYTDRDKYKIIYYGSEQIKRIQIEVPEEEREALMEEIPSKFPNYKLLVYPEGLLEQNAIPSDPFFSNDNAAWYFDVIKAQGAWNETWGKKEIVVAVIDDGFDIQHEELNGKILKPYNVYSRNSNLFIGKCRKAWYTCCGHSSSK